MEQSDNEAESITREEAEFEAEHTILFLSLSERSSRLYEAFRTLSSIFKTRSPDRVFHGHDRHGRSGSAHDNRGNSFARPTGTSITISDRTHSGSCGRREEHPEHF